MFLEKGGNVVCSHCGYYKKQTNKPNFNEKFPFELIQELDELIANVLWSKDKRVEGNCKIAKVSCSLGMLHCCGIPVNDPIQWPNPLPIWCAIEREERSTGNVRQPQFTGRNHRFVSLTWKTGKSSKKKTDEIEKHFQNRQLEFFLEN